MLPAASCSSVNFAFFGDKGVVPISCIFNAYNALVSERCISMPPRRAGYAYSRSGLFSEAYRITPQFVLPREAYVGVPKMDFRSAFEFIGDDRTSSVSDVTASMVGAAVMQFRSHETAYERTSSASISCRFMYVSYQVMSCVAASDLPRIDRCQRSGLVPSMVVPCLLRHLSLWLYTTLSTLPPCLGRIIPNTNLVAIEDQTQLLSY